MASFFRDRAIDHHHDPVGTAHRRQAVRDHKRGASRDKMFEGILHQTLGIRIERRGGFVKNQNRRVLEQRSAMASRWRRPPDNCIPISPIIES